MDALRRRGVRDLAAYIKENPDAMRSLRGKARPIRANAAALGLFEARNEEEFIRNFPAQPAGSNPRRTLEFLENLWEGRVRFESHGDALTLKGRSVPVVFSIQITEVDGRPDLSEVLLAAVDVTELKVVEASLGASQARYRELFEHAPVAMWESDYSGVARWIEKLRAEGVSRILEYIDERPQEWREVVSTIRQVAFNEACMRLFEAPTRQSLENGFPRPREDRLRQMMRSLVEAIWQGATSFEDEIGARTVAGRDIELFARWAVPVSEGNPDYSRTIIAATDITSQRQSERELQKAVDLYHRLVQSSPAMIYTVEGYGDDATTTFMSENVKDHLGYEPDDFLDHPDFWMEKIHPEDVVLVLDERAKLFETGARNYQYRFRRRDGEYRLMNDSVQLVRGADGGSVQIVGYWIDVTERHALEEELQQAQKMESIGRLAGGVAHDFNNLLTVIIGYVDLLRRHVGHSAPEIVGIEKAANRAAELTGQLLAFSRRQRLRPVAMDLNSVVTEQVGMLERLIGEDVRLTTDLEPDVLRVRTDRNQLDQVLMNLVVNARDAMPEGGRVTIETANTEPGVEGAGDSGAAPGPYVRLSVRDTGTGMDEEARARAFEPFFTTKGPGAGTGLGLSTVHGIVRQSGGWVAIDSEPGRGTTVSVHFPPTDHEIEPEPARHPVDSAPASAGETILVAEDDEFVRGLIAQILKREGYSVIEAADGREALRAASSVPRVDLILTDIVMPEMRGPELARRVRAGRPAMKCLFMSAHDDQGFKAGEQNPDVPFIPKPFTPESLAREVRAVLDSDQSG